ncbi:MAG: hypothetical protein IMY67_10825 [Bacteroidetes bacterium]|nr:hypothetical protein [Bacteroidota bacterium]
MRIATIIISIFLTITMLFVSLRVSITYAYYYIDTANFIERLCENKDKPQLECNGKCHLKKVAKKNTPNEQTPTKLVDFKELILFVNHQKKYSINLIFLKKIETTNYNNLYTYTSIDSLYRPPQV